jgi:hypothetical protein
MTGGDKPYNGWMMVGNPYMAYLDWTSVQSSDRTGLNAAIYVFSPNNQQFFSYTNGVTVPDATNADSIQSIAPFQSFLVKASSSSTPSLTFKTSQTKTSTKQNYNFRNAVKPIIYLNSTNAKGKSDVTAVYFENGASDQFDAEFDAEKPAAFDALAPRIFTTNGKEEFVIDGRDVPQNGTIIPVNFSSQENGVQSISINTKAIDPSWSIYLEDKLTGNVHNIKQSAYVFNHNTANNADRFLLHINGLTTSVVDHSSQASKVWCTDGMLNIEFNLNTKQLANVQVLDISGRVLKSFNNIGMIQRFTTDLSDLSEGTYLIQVIINGTAKTFKVRNY